MANYLLHSPFPMVVCCLLYLCQAVGFYKINQTGLALAFLAYALANVGLIMSWYEVQH